MRFPRVFKAAAALALVSLSFSVRATSATPSTPLASEALAPRLGHNVSATSAMLKAGQCTLGPQAAGCGVTRSWSLVTVPWLYLNYNMASGLARVRIKDYDDGGNWTLQLGYFRTYTVARNQKYITYPYEMEAFWLQFIRTVPLAPHARLHLNAATNYYANDKRPFSLRRPVENQRDGQFNLSVLSEVDLINRWFIMAELGGLDIIQPWPHVHTGVSVGRNGRSYEWHLGFSFTSTVLSLFNPRSRRDYQQELRDTAAGFHQRLDRNRTKRDYAIHPEFALQLYF